MLWLLCDFGDLFVVLRPLVILWLMRWICAVFRQVLGRAYLLPANLGRSIFIFQLIYEFFYVSQFQTLLVPGNFSGVFTPFMRFILVLDSCRAPSSLFLDSNINGNVLMWCSLFFIVNFRCRGTRLRQ